MATATVTAATNDSDVATDATKYARIVKFLLQRNMTDFKRIEGSKADVPDRTTSNPSPRKKTAANRHPGQPHTRDEIYGALNQELAKAQFLMHDLGDYLFGHIVSTDLAKAIFQKFVEDGLIQVFEASAHARSKTNPLDPESSDARDAVQQAFEDVGRYECIRATADNRGDQSQQSSANAKRKQQAKPYSFAWRNFPDEPLREDEVVDFLNDITDLAFAVAKPQLGTSNPQLRHRFAAPQDKHHAVPLSYELDGEDMRPDFLLLPIEGFSEDLKTVDAKYVNFTTSRLVGESKNKDAAGGVEQMQRYARGLKRAQPWVYYVLGLTITRAKAVLVRGEGSGTERLDLVLTSGRGCIEFIRILLGLGLANGVDLGQNPHVELGGKEQACKAHNVARRHNFKRPPAKNQVVTIPDALRQAEPKTYSAAFIHSDPAAIRPQVSVIQSSSAKRVHSEIGGGVEEETQSKKCKIEGGVKDVERFVSYPVAVYDHECLGILFTASSIRGRGTTVFCVVDSDQNKLVALKMSWQDVTRVAEQDTVMQHLKRQGPHPNLIVPFSTSKVESEGQLCTTLGAIRGFLQEEILRLGVENRVLALSASELKRPVRYFWGVHDFVRGLRGALLGHEYLTKIGILHRDISENNIVLGLRPEDERGCLIDLDMAILQEAEALTELQPLSEDGDSSDGDSVDEPPSLPRDSKKPMKALRTGTFPYLSFNILLGGRHTQFDDVESFLYVLLLFFFSYAGPLSVSELHKADEEGFVQSMGSGRPPHMRNWPLRYAGWADGEATIIADQKLAAISSTKARRIVRSDEFTCCLVNSWPEKLRVPIRRLITKSFALFRKSVLRTANTVQRTEVSHAEFVSTLDKWLQSYADLEEEFSNCPFKQHPNQSSCDVTM